MFLKLNKLITKNIEFYNVSLFERIIVEYRKIQFLMSECYFYKLNIDLKIIQLFSMTMELEVLPLFIT